mgnify:CR=1 FL=1
MGTKRLGLLLIITPILGFMGWFLSGGPTTPAGDMEGGYGAFAMEFVGKNTDQLHIAMGCCWYWFRFINSLSGCSKSKSS